MLSSGAMTLSNADEQALNELTEQLSNFNWKEGVVDRAKRLLYSDNVDDNIKGALSLKAMLCIGREEVYEVAQEVIDAGVIARLADFLKVDNHILQHPAAFCLTNVAAGLDEQTKVVVEAGAVDPLIGFLTCSNPQLRRQAIFCLANVGGSIPQYRVMLARHPKYFSSMFIAADMAEESKVLELICWNLRNLCLLGGPSFSEIKPGIEFFLNRIIKNYWNFSYWQSCFRFALETVCASMRLEEGREFLLQRNLTEDILNIMGRSHSPVAGNPLAFEIMAWILVYGRNVDKDAFVRDTAVVDTYVKRGVPGHLGSAVQEIALKSLAAIAVDHDQLLTILKAHDDLFDMCGRLFLGLPPTTQSNSDEFGSSSPLTPSTTTVKECAGYVFAHICLFTPQMPTLLMKVVVSNEIVTVLLDIVETGAEQIRQKQHNNLLMADTHCNPQPAAAIEALSPSISANSTIPSDGPVITAVSETLATVGLQALVSLIEQAAILASREGLPENPLLRICLECDAIGRLRKVLDSTALSPDAFELGNVLLQGLMNNVTSSR